MAPTDAQAIPDAAAANAILIQPLPILFSSFFNNYLSNPEADVNGHFRDEQLPF